MSLTVARGVLDNARKAGWVIRPAVYSSRILIAEKSTFASDARRVYGSSEIDLARLLARSRLKAGPPATVRLTGGLDPG